jgi:DNA-binding MarR family transcriptional regulator
MRSDVAAPVQPCTSYAMPDGRIVGDALEPGSLEALLAKSARMLAWITRTLEASCAETGLSLAKYRVLLVLQVGSMRSSEVARIARIGAPTLTALAESLERDGLLVRVRSRSDRRGVRLCITEAGHQAFLRAEQQLIHAVRSPLDRLGGDTTLAETLAGLYDRIARSWLCHGPSVALGDEPAPGAPEDGAPAATSQSD